VSFGPAQMVSFFPLSVVSYALPTIRLAVVVAVRVAAIALNNLANLIALFSEIQLEEPIAAQLLHLATG
jgi:hypothetical protein